PWVVVIGHDVWQSRFASDPKVIGRELRLGNVPHTIVGVMPEGFRFPLAHGFWVPLRLDPVNYPRQQSPILRVFGRLAPGATVETAQPELTVLGATAAPAFPDTHEHLEPRVVPYIDSIFGGFSADSTSEVFGGNLLSVLLVNLLCGQVAPLIVSRAARVADTSRCGCSPGPRRARTRSSCERRLAPAAGGSSGNCSWKRWCWRRWPPSSRGNPRNW